VIEDFGGSDPEVTLNIVQRSAEQLPEDQQELVEQAAVEAIVEQQVAESGTELSEDEIAALQEDIEAASDDGVEIAEQELLAAIEDGTLEETAAGGEPQEEAVADTTDDTTVDNTVDNTVDTAVEDSGSSSGGGTGSPA